MPAITNADCLRMNSQPRHRTAWFFIVFVVMLVFLHFKFDVPIYILILSFVYIWTAYQLRHCFGIK